ARRRAATILRDNRAILEALRDLLVEKKVVEAATLKSLAPSALAAADAPAVAAEEAPKPRGRKESAKARAEPAGRPQPERTSGMAEMTIRLRINPLTGKKDIHIALRSDEDALPHEHEQQHKALVDRLIEGGVLNAAEVGKIVLERDEEVTEP